MAGTRAGTRQGAADEALIRTLYEEHGGALLAYAIRLTGDRAAAEDVVQETLIRAWRNPEVLTNGRGSVRGWLLTVERNLITDRFRAKGARPAEVAEVSEALATVPVQRTLRQARAERGAARRRRWALVGAAAAVAVAAVLGGGVLLGRGTAPAAQVALATPTPVASVPPPVAGTRTVSATDSSTGARMTLTMTPAAGWVRVSAAVTGIPAGQRCHLVVNGRDGARTDAGSWLVSPAGAAGGTTLDGSALVAPADVTSVSVVNESGQTFVNVPL